MSMFGDIMSKIFGHPAAAASTAPAPSSDATEAPATASPEAAASGTAPANASVDVGAVLAAMAAQDTQKLNWQQSIVDLLKLLGLDSSMSARKTLATELHFTGDENDSAGMNTWLHKAVMQKLAENGGKVPDSLKG